MALQNSLSDIRARIERAEKIALFVHVRPDGDSIGSTLALGWALEDCGKQVQFVSVDPVPSRFSFLFAYQEDGKNPFVKEPGDVDCYILTDISSLDRAGSFFREHPEIIPDVCIDHHISNSGIGKLNWIEGSTPATCCVLPRLFPELGLHFTQRIATALLCGIITDTNSFANSDVTPDALRQAAAMMDYGADLFSISQNAYKIHTAPECALWRLGMNHLNMEGGLIWSALRKSERLEAGYSGDDDAGFVTYMGNTEGAKVAVLITEINANEVKASWRSKPGYNVAETAVALGGGGHAAASGATLHGKFEDIVETVLRETRKIPNLQA